MKIIFFGSDNFAAAHLQSLIDSQHKVAACVTQPDRPKGRGMKVSISQVKECAQQNNIPVLQPASLNDNAALEGLKKFQSDIFIVIAYGRFLPDALLALAPLGAVNVHASLLPKYRGAAPVNWAIMNGEKETGISIIKINNQMDAGDILAATKMKIDDDDTALTLKAKMMKAGPDLLRRTLDDLAEGRCAPKAQDHRQATPAPKLTKELGLIPWSKGAGDIYNMVRGLLPWPGAYTYYKGRLLKVLEAGVVEGNALNGGAGTVAKVSKDGIEVVTGENKLLIKKVHLQDSKLMDAYNFVIGHKIEAGFKFNHA